MAPRQPAEVGHAPGPLWLRLARSSEVGCSCAWRPLLASTLRRHGGETAVSDTECAAVPVRWRTHHRNASSAGRERLGNLQSKSCEKSAAERQKSSALPGASSAR